LQVSPVLDAGDEHENLAGRTDDGNGFYAASDWGLGLSEAMKVDALEPAEIKTISEISGSSRRRDFVTHRRYQSTLLAGDHASRNPNSAFRPVY
jgi:hypothetical protein